MFRFQFRYSFIFSEELISVLRAGNGWKSLVEVRVSSSVDRVWLCCFCLLKKILLDCLSREFVVGKML